MVQHCCVLLCKRRFTNPGSVSFHSFPKDPTLRKRWIINIRRDEGENFRISPHTKVCGFHFTPNDFKPILKPKKKDLKPNAVPTIFLWTKTDALQAHLSSINLESRVVSSSTTDALVKRLENAKTTPTLGKDVNNTDVQTCMDFRAFLNTYIKAEPMEEQAILGPKLASLLDPAADEFEGLPKRYIKKELPDEQELQSSEWFKNMEETVELTV